MSYFDEKEKKYKGGSKPDEPTTPVTPTPPPAQ